MSDTITLAVEEPTEGRSAPAWTPGQQTAFAAPGTPEEPEKPNRARKRASRRSASIEPLPYVPLPEKKAKILSKGEQKKADKIAAAKAAAADATTLRINGSDENVKIPKKAWLTLTNRKKARPDEVAETLTDLASMLENGDSEHQSIKALADQYASYDIGEAYERVKLLLERGVTLPAAMADQTDNFPPVVRELLGAANMAKDMHRNLRQAALIIVEADNIKGQVRSALFKPGFMLFLLMGFIILAVTYMLPMTADMFTGIGAEAPPTTVIVMIAGEWLKWIFIVIIGLAILFAIAWQAFLKRNQRIATRADLAALRAPLFGEILKMSAAARFCDVLSACLAVDMSEVESLKTAARACGNKALQKWIDEHVGRQEHGVAGFADVTKTDLFPWNLHNRIATTTSLVRRIDILQELSETFHSKAQVRLNRFAERIGPISEAVVVAAIVGVVVLVASPVLAFIPTMIETVG